LGATFFAIGRRASAFFAGLAAVLGFALGFAGFALRDRHLIGRRKPPRHNDTTSEEAMRPKGARESMRRVVVSWWFIFFLVQLSILPKSATRSIVRRI
jgi:hypothetical protein